MMFILRWPAILALFALALLSFLGAAAAAGAITGFEVGVSQVQDVQSSAVAAGAAESSWIDVGFWTWLIGFALYGGRWALAQEGSLVDTVKGINPQAYLEPQSILSDLATPEAQVGLLGLILVVGLLIFVIDAADRAYWDKQGA
jgi:hypothetical protein